MAEAPTRAAGGPKPAGVSFVEGPVHKHLIRLSGLMFVGSSAWIVASMVETVYVGALGKEPLAALGFTFAFTMLLQSVAMGIGVGASSVLARTIGAGDHEEVRRLITHCIVLVFGGIVVLVLIVSPHLEAIFHLLGARDEVLALVVGYTEIWCIGFPLFTFTMVSTSLLRAIGLAESASMIMMVGSGLQVVLQPLYIFGFWFIPELGLEGAAWGFVNARLLSSSFCFYVIAVRRGQVTADFTGMLVSWGRILHVGIPAMMTGLIGPVSMAVITRLLAAHGPEVVAGFGVGSRVDALMTMIVGSVGMSIGPLVGQNWGARRYARVKLALRQSYQFCLAWGCFAFVFMLLFGELLVSYVNDDPLVIRSAADFLLIIPISIGFMGVGNVASSCFNALGRPMPPLVLSVNRMLVVYVPLALIGDYLWGYVGVFIATSAANILMGIVAWIWNNHTIERHIEGERQVVAAS